MQMTLLCIFKLMLEGRLAEMFYITLSLAVVLKVYTPTTTTNVKI